MLSSQAAQSVNKALEQFVKPEQLDGENSYKCSKYGGALPGRGRAPHRPCPLGGSLPQGRGAVSACVLCRRGDSGSLLGGGGARGRGSPPTHAGLLPTEAPPQCPIWARSSLASALRSGVHLGALLPPRQSRLFLSAVLTWRWGQYMQDTSRSDCSLTCSPEAQGACFQGPFPLLETVFTL